jgi:hypothetical protein
MRLVEVEEFLHRALAALLLDVASRVAAAGCGA